MAGKPFIEIPDVDALAARYVAGECIAEICAGTDISTHTLRRRFLKLGIMRGKSEAPTLAAERGRFTNRATRKGVPQSEEAKAKQSTTMRMLADATARGWRITSRGYVEKTRKGDDEGRLVHVLIMEKRIGRRLLADEIVHHIDGDKLNNDENNLALMTSSAHGRLHRFEDKLAGKDSKRSSNGQFMKGIDACR